MFVCGIPDRWRYQTMQGKYGQPHRQFGVVSNVKMDSVACGCGERSKHAVKFVDGPMAHTRPYGAFVRMLLVKLGVISDRSPVVSLSTFDML